VLDADGVAVTDCVVGDFKLKKTTGNFAALNGSATLTHVSAGTYDLVLTTSDLDTVGLATVAIDDTVNACSPLYLQVVEEAVYDALYAASAVGPLLATSTGSGFSAIPWNASWDAEVQSEAADALNAYDPPTHAETLAAAGLLYDEDTIDTVHGTADLEVANGWVNPDELVGAMVVIRDVNGGNEYYIGTVVTTASAVRFTCTPTPNFTVQVGDTIRFYRNPASLLAILLKLPSKTYLTGTTNSDGDVQMNEATGNYPGTVAGIAGTITTLDALDTAQDSQHSTTQGLVTTVDTVVDSILASMLPVLHTDTVATVNSTTDFDGNLAVAGNTVRAGDIIVFYDASGSNRPSVCRVVSFDNTTPNVMVTPAPAFTVATSDPFKIFAAPVQLASILATVDHATYGNAALKTAIDGVSGAYVSDSGTAQAGAAGTLTLRSGAVATDDYYNYQILTLTGGTGAGQARIISDYVGSTKVASVNGNWATTPDNTTTYTVTAFGQIPGASAPTAGEVADAVWDEATSGHTTSGTFGEQAKTDIDSILSRTTTALPNVAPAANGGLPTVDANNYVKGLQSASNLHQFDDLDEAEDMRFKLHADQPDYVPATAAALTTVGGNVTTALGRLGSWTGTGRNTILGAIQALFRKDADATVPSDVNADLGSGAGSAANTTDSLQGQRDNVGTAGAGLTEVSGGGGDSAALLLSTTIATLTNQTTFTLTDGPPDNDALTDAIAIIIDQSDTTQKTFAPIKKYVASTKKVILSRAPKFTIASGDTFKAVIDSKPLLSPEFVDRDHTWRFDNSRQTTAPNRVTENTAFDGLTKIDFTNCIDSDDSLASINSVTISPTAGDEPTLGTSYLHTDGKSVVVPIACTEDGDPCDTGTYTITASITTADAQVKSRACKFIVESA
jgi:hypothetical protein